MPNRFEPDGRYNVYDGKGNLVAKINNYSEVVEILGNNQGDGYSWEDTKKEQ